MYTSEDIRNIRNEKDFHDRLRVKKVGNGVYTIISFAYGDEVEKLTGYPAEVAKYLNGYFGLREDTL